MLSMYLSALLFKVFPLKLEPNFSNVLYDSAK